MVLGVVGISAHDKEHNHSNCHDDYCCYRIRYLHILRLLFGNGCGFPLLLGLCRLTCLCLLCFSSINFSLCLLQKSLSFSLLLGGCR